MALDDAKASAGQERATLHEGSPDSVVRGDFLSPENYETNPPRESCFPDSSDDQDICDYKSPGGFGDQDPEFGVCIAPVLRCSSAERPIQRHPRLPLLATERRQPSGPQ